MPNIVITGAGSGIGRTVARRFLKAGWQVALVGRRADRLDETAEGSEHAFILPFDVGEPDQVDAGFAEYGRACPRSRIG